MKELEDLCEAINRGEYKSKQTVFNHYLDDFCNAKDRYGWGRVVDFLNKETGVELNIETYRSMLKRAKKKVAGKQKKPTMEQRAVEIGAKRSKASSINEKGSSSGEIDYNSYMNACFNNKLLAQRAIDSNVAVETIKSWGCANFVQVSNALGNYIRNKG